MGKQVGFYMTLADERAFLENVRQEHGPLTAILSPSKERLEVVEALSVAGNVHKDIVICLATTLNDIIVKHYPAQGWYCVDVMNSEVIQFGRCAMKQGWLAPGRLWFDERTMTGRKSEEFCAWANRLIAWFRRSYQRTDERNCFVGPQAAGLSARGLLKLGPPMEGIPLEEAKRILGIE